jgi:hypothetical protein
MSFALVGRIALSAAVSSSTPTKTTAGMGETRRVSRQAMLGRE